MPDASSPLRIPLFRRAWASSVLTNLGLLVQGVGVTWAMVEIGSNDALVAWVQAATALPLMLLSLPAGAIADVFNRRRVALCGLFVALAGASLLALGSQYELLTPTLLLLLCFVTGAGVATYDPAWQASVPSLVPREVLPQAIALRSISHNLARAVGPALGGALVAWQGGRAAFIAAALLYLPLIAVLFHWRYQPATPRLPPERIAEAMRTGVRFVRNSPLTRVLVIRAFVAGTFGIGILSLLPLVAKYIVDGGAVAYGILLGGFGAGAVIGAAAISIVREHVNTERIIAYSTIAIGVAAIALAWLSNLVVMTAVTCLAGMAWMLIFSNINIKVQSLAPRWVMGRVLATYGAAATAGMFFGSIGWGYLVQAVGIVIALEIVGGVNLAASLLGLWLRIPDRKALALETSGVVPEVSLALDVTHRSGPIEVVNEYRIAPFHARRFYRQMEKVERLRKRNGAYDWSISRDITDDTVWIERFRFSTWLDFLRMHGRMTGRDQELLDAAEQHQLADTDIESRLRLVRPMGSVRWRAEVADPQDDGSSRHDLNY